MLGGVEIYGTGTVPAKSDSRRMALVKKLWTVQNHLAIPNPLNNPTKADTTRTLIAKILNAVQGLTGPF